MGILVAVLLVVTAFNSWLLLQNRRDLVRLKSELSSAQKQLGAAPAKALAEAPAASASVSPSQPRTSTPNLSPGAEVARRFFDNLVDARFDEAMADASESLTRDGVRDFHAQNERRFEGLDVASVDDGDARATLHLTAADRARFSATAALVGKRWLVIELTAG